MSRSRGTPRSALAGGAPVLVDRHATASLPRRRRSSSCARSRRGRASTPSDADLEAVLGFLGAILPALARSRGGIAAGCAGMDVARRRLSGMSVARLAERVRAGELSPREAVQACLERIERLNPHLNAYHHRAGGGGAGRGGRACVPAGPSARGAGRRQGRDRRRGHAHDRRLAHPRRQRRRRATPSPSRACGPPGAVVVGKLNTHEFAFGATTTSPHFGPARNPWAPDRICGGSSGGSGAAAAAELAAGTLGTDTAGSIRIPAALCGVTGLRPTTGRVPIRGRRPRLVDVRHGRPARAERRGLRTAARRDRGPTRRPDDHARAEPDARDRRPAHRGRRARCSTAPSPRVAAAVREADRGALRRSEPRSSRSRCRCSSEAGTIQQLVMLPEATRCTSQWLRTRLADYGADVRARLLAGLLLPATAYVTGLRARRAYCAQASSGCSSASTCSWRPRCPSPAPRIGEDDGRGSRRACRLPPRADPVQLALERSRGCRSLSVPCGFVDGLPVGLALVGRRLAARRPCSVRRTRSSV